MRSPLTLFPPVGAPLGPETPFGSFPLFPQSPLPTSSRPRPPFSENPCDPAVFTFFPATLDATNAFFTHNQAVPFPVCPSAPSVLAYLVARPRGYAVAPSPPPPCFSPNPEATDARKNKGAKGTSHAQRPPFTVRFALFFLPPFLLAP